MKAIVTAVVAGLLVSTSAFAALPPAVSKAAAKIQSESIRVRVKQVTNPTGPCDPDYLADVQIKKAVYDQLKQEVVYTWESVKQVGIDKDGRLMEVCAE